MIDIVIAAALWCGEPTYSGVRRPPVEVDACRERIIKCLSEHYPVSTKEWSMGCVQKEKLK